MNFFNIKSIAKYEMKLLLRTARFWVLCGIGFLTGCIWTTIVTLFNIFGSGQTSVGGFMAVSSAGYYTLFYFNFIINVVMIFFVLNFKSKDDSSKINDVLLSKSLSSFDIILGKYLGVVIPVLFVNLFTMILSLMALFIFLDIPVKFENYFYYFIIINFPSILFISAFEFFIVLFLKNRFLGLLVSLGYVGSVMVWFAKYYHNLFDFGCYRITMFASDLIGLGNINKIIIQRLLYFVLAFIFLGLTIIVYPRLRQLKREYVILKFVIIILVFISSSIVYYFPHQAKERANYRNSALETEKKYVDYIAPMIKHYSMRIDMTKKKGLDVSAQIHILNDTPQKLDQLVFSLNPGMKITKCSIEKGTEQRDVEYERDYGIIKINISEFSLLPNDSINVVINYNGSLDERAFFLDFDESKVNKNENIVLQEVMGAIYYFFGNDYSFILPETGWYPTIGVIYGYQYPNKKRISYATSDIQIMAPRGHRGITQGKLISVVNNKNETIYNWISNTPIPKFSLNTGKYASVSAVLDSIDCTLYYSPMHKRNIPFFSDISDTLKGFIADKLRENRVRTDLHYPYECYSLIEVPVQVAEFSRNWDSQDLMNQPGISMMKEGGILLANFERAFSDRIRRARRRGEDTTRANIKIDVLKNYISNSAMFESRLEHKIIPNYWKFRFEPKGVLYPLLSFGMNDFVTEWITGTMPLRPVKIKPGTFSTSISDEDVSVSGTMISPTKIDSLYKLLEKMSLVDFSPNKDPDMFKAVLDVKGKAMIKSLMEIVGKDKFGEILKIFISKHSYSNPTIEDFKNTVAEYYKKDMNNFFNFWLSDTKIPGFQLENIEAYKIGSEIPSYQVITRLKNGENGEGFVKLTFKTEKDEIVKFLNFINYEEKEIKFIVPDKPLYLDVEPFFSLNRESFREYFSVSENKILKKGEEYYKTISTQPDTSVEEIIVDNLDNNFYAIDLSKESFFRPKKLNKITKEFVPLYITGNPHTWGSLNKWRLNTSKYAYGKYRHTYLFKNKGSGKQSAIWEANINEPGEYKIYYYYGDDDAFKTRFSRFYNKLGKTYKFTIYHKDGKDDIKFYLKSGENGWNELGSFHFSKGNYRVELSDESDGMIIADAIKWTKK
jgi:ABC-type transport system involved in multi-copper enzyme maturation permease subunit